MARFEEVFSDVTKVGYKIPTSEYLVTGKYPIIDQGQEKIAGYTNLEEGIFSDVPAIVFGDHTRIVKYIETPFYLGADGVKILKCRLQNTDSKYLYYCLSNARIPNTGYNRHFKWLKEINIPLPPLDEQRKIAAVLDKVSDLIAKRRQQLDKLDTLVKARFVEMFGDPTLNPYGLEKKRFDTICENLDSRRRPITSSDRVAGIYPYYGASGIVDYVEDYIFDEDILLVSEDGANLLMRSTAIAFSVSGKVWVNNHAHVVRFDNLATQKYIEVYFSLIDISDQITGSAQPKLNQARLNAMEFMYPPIKRQEQFASFVAQVDKSKMVVSQSLEKLGMLKKSLMQLYWG